MSSGTEGYTIQCMGCGVYRVVRNRLYFTECDCALRRKEEQLELDSTCECPLDYFLAFPHVN